MILIKYYCIVYTLVAPKGKCSFTLYTPLGQLQLQSSLLIHCLVQLFFEPISTACVMHSLTSLFIAAHNLYHMRCIGMVLPLASALNISRLMNHHHPGGTVIHPIHANFWVFLDPFLRTLLFFWLLPHRGILLPFKWEQRTIIIDSCTIKAGQSETDSYETRLAKILSETEVWWLTRPWPPHHVVFTSCCLTERDSSRSVQRHSYQLKKLDSNALWGRFSTVS